MRFKRILLVLLLQTVSHAALAALPQAPCDSICDSAQSHKGQCLLINRQRMYMRTQGRGTETMVFASGTGFPADGWFDANIANVMAKKTRVLSYDRLYTFNSCPNRNNYMPNTARDVVEHLRALLKQRNVKPPYILVGQSFGGLYMLLYAREYPSEVAGLVLMDASSSAGPTALPEQALPILKRLGNPQNPVATNPLYNEQIGQLPSYLQMDAAPALPRTMPLIVMVASKHCLPASLTGGKRFCMTAQQERNHMHEQLAIYNMSDNHRLVKVRGGHMSFFEPRKHRIVIKALKQILAMKKTSKLT